MSSNASLDVWFTLSIRHYLLNASVHIYNRLFLGTVGYIVQLIFLT